MLTQFVMQEYLHILRSSLISAFGCTEPIAVAYAAAKAREVLGTFPERIEVHCSGNIIKNVKGVIVPNSGGMYGIEAAAVLGVVGGDPALALEVLSVVTEKDCVETKKLISTGYCACHLHESDENLYICVKAYYGSDNASITIEHQHNVISKIKKNGKFLINDARIEEENSVSDYSLLNVKDILYFAQIVPLKELRPIIEPQIRLNTAIADEGLKHAYGAQVGRTLLEVYGDDVTVRAKARAAAGSDARMSGCPCPVVINSGSGNQGMAVSLPVIEFAKELRVSKEKLYRALVVSNLVSIHQKRYIGSLSAYCGAVSAACGSGAGITYLYGGGYEEVSATITNTIANVGGIVCDGAKASCAAKIASAVDAAIMAHFMSIRHLSFRPGEGLVKKDVEGTIENLGQVGRLGMRETDTQILRLMLNNDCQIQP